MEVFLIMMILGSSVVGGDQLTASRIRGTQAQRRLQDKAVDRLEGVIPVVEDWQARMALMKVS